ncbi:MAG: hypothetical protein IPO78_08495 [Saprospiraceae bacterium]|nr:hypothetical protein [Saprospiraceae bacterium]MBK9721648.1 hypothetical protein [Saprospiraceae bacterium]
MYLIADAGSTKCDWVLFDHSQSIYFKTKGINPSTQDQNTIKKSILELREQLAFNPHKIFFYGAGCSSPSAINIITTILTQSFLSADIYIYTDLLGTARALCDGKPGIVAILGTGSHAAFCDGHKIIHQLPSLGYLLGDEGSGNYLGKSILQAYFLGKLDSELELKFEQEYPEIKQDFIFQLYHSESVSAFLAKYAAFIIKYKNHPSIAKIIEMAIDTFITTRLIIYKEKQGIPVHLCGSIASLLSMEIKQRIIKFGLEPGTFLQKPITEIMKYHLTYEYN